MRWLGLASGLALSACGGELALMVEVDLSSYEVPTEVDLIHLELRAGDDVLGRNFELEAGDQEPLFELLPGSRTPERVDLVAYAYLGTTLVSTSPPVGVRLGEQKKVRLLLP